MGGAKVNGGAFSLQGKVAMVTGAGRGIGRGCALALAGAGAEIIAVSRTAGEIEALAGEIKAAGGKARAMACDVTDTPALDRLFAGVPRLDVLVNNAGANKPQPFIDVDEATLDRILTLNVRSAFLVAQRAARVMVKQKSGVIVNMSSQMGHVGGPNRTVYCASKHAIEGLTKAMAVELAPLGIRAVAVAPTFIETPMTKPFLADASFMAQVMSSIPMGRTGTVDEVANAVLFLASPAAGMVTGTSLLVDGGWTAR
ncbi:MAG: SDR family oxidoreductase [Alphaproteobacteria bacterium]|nr:SDR family oxidoreductase [Alphaproteobacteria bacterium]